MQSTLWSDFCAKFRQLYPGNSISSTYISIRYRYLDSSQRARFLLLRNKNDLRDFVESLSAEAKQYWSVTYIPISSDCKTFEDTLETLVIDWSPELHGTELSMNAVRKRGASMLGIFLESQLYKNLCFIYDPIDTVQQPMKWAAYVGKECLPFASLEWIPD